MNKDIGTLQPLLPGAEGGVILPKTHTYKTLDAWRGIACLWVLWFHSTAPLVDILHIKPGLLYVLPLNGGLGIWMFFVISGYCIAHAGTQALKRNKGIQPYAAARFRRIFPPCWFSLIFYLLASALATFLVTHGYLKSSNLAGKGVLHEGVAFYLSNVSLTQIIFHQEYVSSVCWTLCYEVAFYALVGLGVFLAARFGDERRLLTGLHSLTLASLVFLLCLPHKAIYPFDFWPMFGLGILIYDLVKHGRRLIWALFLIAAVLIVAFAWRSPVGIGYHEVGGGRPFLFGLVFALLLLVLHPNDARLSRLSIIRALSWIGLFSYSLYLIHVLIVGLVLQILGKLKLESIGFCVPVCVIVSVVAAFMFYQFFERPFVQKAVQP